MKRRTVLAGSLLAAASPLAGLLRAQEGKTGPAVGTRIPGFSALDQHGRRRSLADLAGPQGLLLIFVRSADW